MATRSKGQTPNVALQGLDFLTPINSLTFSSSADEIVQVYVSAGSCQ